MIGIAEDGGYDFAFLKGVIEVNDEQFDRVVEKIRLAAGGSLEGVKIGVLGLTFKAGTDDMRDSPSIEITGRLMEAGAVVSAYDPVATECPIEGVTVVGDAYAAADGADVLAILTEWEEFKFIDLDKLAEVMSKLHIVDGRNLLDRGAVRRRGFSYQGIGRS